MPKFEVIVPRGLQGVYDNWHFAPAVRVNGMLYCSGVIGTSPGGEPIAKSGGSSEKAFDGAQATLAAKNAELADILAVRDPEAQFEAAFEIIQAVLAEAGAQLADVVEMTTYHVDISQHMATFMAVKDRYLFEPYPAWTAIGVSELIIPGGLMEISVIAVAP